MLASGVKRETLVVADMKTYDFGTIRSLPSAPLISFWESCSSWFDSGASGRTINAHVSEITRRDAFVERLSWVINRAVATAKTGHEMAGFAIHI
jgi:hypothetical protein